LSLISIANTRLQSGDRLESLATGEPALAGVIQTITA